ncbi:MAG: hypothetical protein R3345_07635 [Fulvivirga sp.]|nr:hypothetical protein [Fulvivirga sp.]
MEYSFKTNEKDQTRIIHLESDKLVYFMDDERQEVPYNQIHSVWLSKPGGVLTPNSYSCTLNIKNAKPIYISSKNWDDEKKEILQQNHYNSFVRVLHLHLKEKSRAQYGFGLPPASYLSKLAILLLIVCSTIYWALSSQLSGTMLIGTIGLGVLIVIIGLNFSLKNYPSHYQPDQIPLNLLPSNS